MKFKRLLVTLSLLAFSFGFANDAHEGHSGLGKEETYNPVPFIMHHIQDGHSWHFWCEGEYSVTLHLPVILWDNGLKVFSSSRCSFYRW